jgi:putative intracellular protease/amidase
MARPLLKGKSATAYTGAKEVKNGAVCKALPIKLETSTLKKAEPFKEKVVVCGRLVTGQNGASAAALAQAVMRLVEELAASGGPDTPTGGGKPS